MNYEQKIGDFQKDLTWRMQNVLVEFQRVFNMTRSAVLYDVFSYMDNVMIDIAEGNQLPAGMTEPLYNNLTFIYSIMW